MQAAFLALLLGEHAAPEDPDRVVYASVMAWDHAQPAADSRITGREMFQIDAARRAGVCGDFFGGGVDAGGVSGVEAAALSGLALGEALALRCGLATAGTPAAGRSDL